jgi:hypothetical protein
MKKLLVVCAMSLMANAFANPIVDGVKGAIAITMSPITISAYLVMCAAGQTSGDVCAAAQTAASFTSPFVTSSILLLKQEVREVEGDAYAFLAGEGMTDALQDLIEKLRSEHEQLNDMSDKELVTDMMSVLEIK